MEAKELKINIGLEAQSLVCNLDPITPLVENEFRRRCKLYSGDQNQEYNDMYYFIQLCKAFNNSFNDYLAKLNDLIKSQTFVWFTVFQSKHRVIKEEILLNFGRITNDYNKIDENNRNNYFIYNDCLGNSYFDYLLKELIESIYNKIEIIYKEIDKYDKKVENLNKSKDVFDLTEEKNNWIRIYEKIFAQFWRNIPKYLSSFGFYYKDFDRFLKFEEKFENILNTGLENNNRREEVIELNKNIREQKELFEELSSSRDRIESELKLSTDLKNEMISQIKGLKEDNKKLTEIIENYGSIESKIDLIISHVLDLSEEMIKITEILLENEFKSKSNTQNDWKLKEDMFEEVINENNRSLLNSSKEYQNLLEYKTRLEIKINRMRESEELLAGIESEVKTAMDSDSESNSNQGEDDETTFRFKIENFSQLIGETSSQPTFLHNLPWKILAIPLTDRDRHPNKNLGLYLQCNGESLSSTWSCKATAELRIISQREGIENKSRKIQHIFYSNEKELGFRNFLGWSDILNPEKGYIKDDAIILEVWVSAEPPHGV